MRAKFLLVALAVTFTISSSAVYSAEKATRPFKTKTGAAVVMKNGTAVHSRTKNFHRG